MIPIKKNVKKSTSNFTNPVDVELLSYEKCNCDD